MVLHMDSSDGFWLVHAGGHAAPRGRCLVAGVEPPPVVPLGQAGPPSVGRRSGSSELVQGLLANVLFVYRCVHIEKIRRSTCGSSTEGGRTTLHAGRATTRNGCLASRPPPRASGRRTGSPRTTQAPPEPGVWGVAGIPRPNNPLVRTCTGRNPAHERPGATVTAPCVDVIRCAMAAPGVRGKEQPPSVGTPARQGLRPPRRRPGPGRVGERVGV